MHSKLCMGLPQVDFLGEVTTGNLHLVDSVTTEGTVNVLGLSHLGDIVDVPYEDLKDSQKVRISALACTHACTQAVPEPVCLATIAAVERRQSC